MIRYKRLFYVTLLFILLWLLFVPVFLYDNLPVLNIVLIVLPVLLAVYIIWQQHKLMPGQQWQQLEQLAKDVQSQISGDRIPIDIDALPTEIKPLGEAINALLAYDADRISQEKTFSADASHELRTPLAGIRLQTQLAMQSRDPKQRERAHKNIIKAIDRATRLVEQLLVLSRLTAERVELSIEEFDMDAVCARVIAEYYQEAKNRGVQLTFERDEADYRLKANEQSIAILLQNLLRNALRFTPEQGQVVVNLKRCDKTLCLSVTDSGPGIPEDQYDRVLQRFQKADNGGKGGTGLGLAIVKRIVDLHNSELVLAPNPDGRGLQITVIFPGLS